MTKHMPRRPRTTTNYTTRPKRHNARTKTHEDIHENKKDHHHAGHATDNNAGDAKDDDDRTLNHRGPRVATR